MEKRKKKIKEMYKEAFDYIKECKRFIFAIVIIFIASSLLGFFLPTPPQIEESIIKFIQELLEKTKDMNQIELISFIFTNNLQSSFIGMTLGILLGIFPLIITLMNGYLLGYIAEMASEAESILSLWRLFPHGIFELPAIFIALGMGLKISAFAFQKNKIKSLKRNIIKSLKTFVLIIIPLLIIAAIIEGTLIFLSQ